MVQSYGQFELVLAPKMLLKKQAVPVQFTFLNLLSVLWQEAMVTEYSHEGGDLLVIFPA